MVALQATVEQKSVWRETVQIFRHGNGAGFSGFNDDRSTNWSTHAAKMAQAGKANAEIATKIGNLPKSGDSDAQKMELQQQLIDIPKTLGFCKTVGPKESILNINMPDVDAQLELNRKFDLHEAPNMSGSI